MRRRENQQDQLVAIEIRGRQDAIAVVQEELEGAGIDYVLPSDRAQDYFGLGRLGTDFNYITGPVRILVSRDDEQAARAIVDEVVISGTRRLSLPMRLLLLALCLLPSLIILVIALWRMFAG